MRVSMTAEMRRQFEMLDLKPTANLAEAKQAYRDLLMVWHPDRFPQNSRLQQAAQEKTKEINEAYQQIKRSLDTHGSWTGQAEDQKGDNTTSNAEHTSKRDPKEQFNRTRKQTRTTHFDSEPAWGAERKEELWTFTGTVLLTAILVVSAIVLSSQKITGWPLLVLLIVEFLLGAAGFSAVKTSVTETKPTMSSYFRSFASISLWTLLALAVAVTWLFGERDKAERVEMRTNSRGRMTMNKQAATAKLVNSVVRLYNSKGQQFRTIIGTQATSVSVSGTTIAVTLRDGKVKLFDLTGRYIRTI